MLVFTIQFPGTFYHGLLDKRGQTYIFFLRVFLQCDGDITNRWQIDGNRDDSILS